MIKSEQASLSVMRIAVITILTIFCLSASVLAASTNVKNIKIVLSDNCEIEVLTTKSKVSDILEENHIVVLPEENVVPNLDSEIVDTSSTIVITGTTQDAYAVIAIAEEEEKVPIDQLLSAYNTITEKIITVDEVIPYNVVMEDGSSDTSSANKVVRKGKDGLKKCTYRIKYQNDIEIDRTLIKEEIVEEPVDKIVKKTVSARNTNVATTKKLENIPTPNSSSLAKKVEGITPIVKTLNASAYSAADCGKSINSPSYGITSSGARATAWYTVAAGPAYPMGTIVYIPYFSNEPNGGWFVVQDRGGAITNSKIDIYMTTHNECIKFGRRNLECYIYMVD